MERGRVKSEARGPGGRGSEEMNCEQTRRALNALVDGELRPWTAGRVRRHLSRCAACAGERQAMERLTEQARGWRDVAATAGLEARVAAALARSLPAALAPAASPSRAEQRKARIWMTTARWAGGATVIALGITLWAGGRKGGSVVAAAIQATEAAPAVHMVGHSSRGSEYEGWMVAGKGSYSRALGDGHEMVMVDDLQRIYQYSKNENRVTIMATQWGDPKRVGEVGGMFTLTGALRDLQREHKPEAILVETVTKDGRQLRRITAKGEPQTFYMDPRTNRLVLIEGSGPGISRRIEQVRVIIDYPDPATVDSALFRFAVPPGATVVDQTHQKSGGTPYWLLKDPGDQCSWHLLMLKKALLGYVTDHHGQWPRALRPDLDLYVKDNADFYCPADRLSKGKATSYQYHRPVTPADPGKLAEQWEVDINVIQPDIPDRTGLLVECRFHDARRIGLYMDGAVLTDVTGRRRPEVSDPK